MKPRSRIYTLEEAKLLLRSFGSNPRLKTRTGWPAGKAIVHCAQSIEFSMDGFPKAAAAKRGGWLGRLKLWIVMRRGYLGHSLTDPIPGAPAIPDDTDAIAAMRRLYKAIERFEHHRGSFAEHFVFGPLDRKQYATLHAMHLTDHFDVIRREVD